MAGTPLTWSWGWQVRRKGDTSLQSPRLPSLPRTPRWGASPSQVLGGGGLPAVTYLLPSTTPHPRDSDLLGEGQSWNKGVFVPGSWGAGVALVSVSWFLRVPGVLEAQRRNLPRWGAVLHDPRAPVRARRPGPLWALKGSTERPWGCRSRKKRGWKKEPGTRRVQSPDPGLLWPPLGGRGVAPSAATLPSSLPGPILSTPGPPPLPSSRSRWLLPAWHFPEEPSSRTNFDGEFHTGLEKCRL